jgi:hypothetical protein
MSRVAIVTAESENAARGAAWALLAVPASMIVFGVLGGGLGLISGIPAFGVPLLTAWLFARGSGGRLAPSGWRRFTILTSIAVVVGLLTGVMTAAAHAFVRVGGEGLGAYATTVRNQFASAGTVLQLLLGLALGTTALILMLRRSRITVTDPE